MLSLYLTWVPIKFGKYRILRQLADRWFLGRSITLVGRTKFGARMKLKLSDQLQFYLYFFGVWEPAITSYVRAALKAGDTFIDVGANIGYYSLLASRTVGANGHVYAFEASPSIFTKLTDNLALNNTVNVSAQNVAVTDRAAKVSIFRENHNLGESTIIASHASRLGAMREATVDGKTLIELVGPHVLCSARLIKIDVEGAEWSVVRGFASLLPRLSPTTEILIEANSKIAGEEGWSAEALFRLFADAGLVVLEIPNVYTPGFYIDPPEPVLKPYDGSPFIMKDFLIRQPRPDDSG